MSCSSTPASSAAFSAACLAEPTLTRPQMQSLFHQLRREADRDGRPAPRQQEYLDGLDRMELWVRTDPSLTERARGSLVGRLAQARLDPPPDGATWHAVEEIRAHARLSAARLEQRFTTVGRDLGVDPARVQACFGQWRDAEEGLFEDRGAPDRRFRYDVDPAVPGDDATARALRKLGYEHYLAQPYPVFVYGTLRRGHGNHVLLQGAAERIVPAEAPGVAVYGSSYGFPYAAEHSDPSAVAKGEIVWLSRDASGEQARENLDYLEGFDSNFPSTSHYERIVRHIVVPGGDGTTATVPAWIYLARGNSRQGLREEDRIVHGDWAAARSR